MRPNEIEAQSIGIIKNELNRDINPLYEPIILRVIHATADFEYADLITFSDNAIESAREAFKRREIIITDTNMAKAGITRAASLEIEVMCFMSDEGVMEEAIKRNITRAAVSMEKAAALPGRPIFVIGNAPTALLRLCELIREGRVKPSFIIGAPVGFVNVIESKETLMNADTPYICVKGRKGGSAVAAAIANGIMINL